MVDNIAGLYKSTIVRNDELKFSDLGYVIVYKNDDGTYGMSCAIGSYYENGNSNIEFRFSDIIPNSIDDFIILIKKFRWNYSNRV